MELPTALYDVELVKQGEKESFLLSTLEGKSFFKAKPSLREKNKYVWPLETYSLVITNIYYCNP